MHWEEDLQDRLQDQIVMFWLRLQRKEDKNLQVVVLKEKLSFPSQELICPNYLMIVKLV
jgi:hypothetical protein